MTNRLSKKFWQKNWRDFRNPIIPQKLLKKFISLLDNVVKLIWSNIFNILPKVVNSNALRISISILKQTICLYFKNVQSSQKCKSCALFHWDRLKFVDLQLNSFLYPLPKKGLNCFVKFFVSENWSSVNNFFWKRSLMSHATLYSSTLFIKYFHFVRIFDRLTDFGPENTVLPLPLFNFQLFFSLIECKEHS